MFRQYDPRLGRWLTLDPEFKKFPDMNPFTGLGNSPMIIPDPNGNVIPIVLGIGYGVAAIVGIFTTANTIHEVHDGVAYGEWEYEWGGMFKSASEQPATTSTGSTYNPTFKVVKSPKGGGGANQPATPNTPVFPLPIGGSVEWGDTNPNTNPDSNPTNDTNPENSPDEDNNDKDDYITLHRGVSADAKNPQMYREALSGVAVPNGLRPGEIPHRDMDLHAAGDNYSIWTSWTVSERQAEHFAKGPMGTSNGVVLTKTFPKSRVTINTSESARLMQEGEVLVPGVVTGARVRKTR